MDNPGIVRNALLALLLLILAFFSQTGHRPSIPVCHAKTEDSVITDCDYHDGTWWTK